MQVRRRARMATGLVAVAGLVIAGTVAATPSQAGSKADPGRFRLADTQPDQKGKTITAALEAAKKSKGADGRAHLVVRLKDQPLSSYTGGVAGLKATSPRVTGAKRVDVDSAASEDYLSYLGRRMNAFEQRVKTRAPGARFGTRLKTVVGGIAVSVPLDQVAALAADPQVAAVYADTLNQPVAADRSPGFIGAPSAWAKAGGVGKAGEKVIVGVLDSGVWPEHPSFSDPDPAGKAYPAPRPRLDGQPRDCDFSSGANPGAAFTCNNKLIGAYLFMDTYEAATGYAPGETTSVRDDDGHGTHTATTAAGNADVPASVFGVNRGTVSGIAPRAQVIAYRVCGTAGCYGSDSAAAVQQAIVDDVDVINFSISGGSNPYGDVVSLAFLDAYTAGIFVAASAGNSGPDADTTDHREPWVTTVAASTLDRSFVGSTRLTSSDGATRTVTGATISESLTTAAPVVNAATAGDEFCVDDTADDAFAGQVVICRRGAGIGRVQKGVNVLARGAVGMILDNGAETDLETDNHALPAIHLATADGASVRSFVAAHPDVTATITSGSPTSSQGDIMASFSSRGGPGQSLGISKPDVTAPGVQILAGNTPLAVPGGQLFQAIAGTSMSGPHVAGAGAMMVALHPNWTPGQIKSALMTTAVTSTVKEDGVTPSDAFDDGSGRIDLRRSPDPLFTIDETAANYVALKSELFKANYPSLYVPALAGQLTVQRTLKSVSSRTQYYAATVKADKGLKVWVSSPVFSLRPGASRTLSITVDGRDIPLGETRFATVTFWSGLTKVTFPVTVVRKQGPVAIEKTCAPDPVRRGASTTCTVSLTNNSTEDATVTVRGKVPYQLSVNAGSVVDGTKSGNTVTATRTIPGKQAPDISVADVPLGSPAGYLPLSAFGITPIAGVGDETITNFNVPEFTVAGITYSRIGVVSNGYVVLGGGTGADVQFVNTDLPDAGPPNNIVAPFWTDLNPAAGGAIRVGTLTDGVNDWIIVDYDAVKEYSGVKANSFQVWIRTGTTEDLTMTYGELQGDGDGGFLTVGAENPDGTKGQAVYLDGEGTLPTSATELVVTGTPGVTSSATVTYTAKGVWTGSYVNYAEATSPVFDGVAIARFAGKVIR
jgi:hypothetical protein